MRKFELARCLPLYIPALLSRHTTYRLKRPPLWGERKTWPASPTGWQIQLAGLLTLVGPGGIGKTRLAIQAAQDVIDDLPDQVTFGHGIYFVSLAPIRSTDQLAPTIADVLTLTLYDKVNQKAQLLDYMREKEMLLLLDNFEHLLEAVDLITDILTTAPAVKIIITSREVLHLQKAWFYPVGGMQIPLDEAMKEGEISLPLEDYGAIALFKQCARRVSPDFSLADEQASVYRICRLVEGGAIGY